MNEPTDPNRTPNQTGAPAPGPGMPPANTSPYWPEPPATPATQPAFHRRTVYGSIIEPILDGAVVGIAVLVLLVTSVGLVLGFATGLIPGLIGTLLGLP